MDRKSLSRLWEENELIFRGRSKEEHEFYADNGLWPERRGRLHYFLEDGKLQVEWCDGKEKEDISAEKITQQREV